MFPGSGGGDSGVGGGGGINCYYSKLGRGILGGKGGY